MFEDGGRVVCIECVWRLTLAAAHPELLSSMERRLLAEAHADVVQLIYPATDGRCHWLWRGWR